MKVLTIHQPYAWFIVNGHKIWENRDYPLRIRGSLLIHAGKSQRYWNKLSDYTKSKLPTPFSAGYTVGAIVGAVNFTDCVPVCEIQDDQFATGPWCWKFEDAVEFAKPIPVRGKQGIWNVDDGVVLWQLQQAGFVPRDMKLGGRAA